MGSDPPRVDRTRGPTPSKKQARELVIMRNVGGRVTPDVLSQLPVLRGVSQAAGGDLGAGWEIVVLHHTECGIAKIVRRPDLLAPFFGVQPDELAARAVDDPRAAVAFDVGAVRAKTRLGDGIRGSGLVDDVSTGLVETVMAPGCERDTCAIGVRHPAASPARMLLVGAESAGGEALECGADSLAHPGT